MQVKELIDTINKENVPVIYESADVVCEKILTGTLRFPVFSVFEGEERKEYEHCKNQGDFISHSACIHMPDIAVDEMAQIFKCNAYKDEDSTYGDMLQTIQPYLRANIPEDITVVCFAFLHEVGHYRHFESLGFRAKAYMDLDLSLYEEHNRKMNELDMARRERMERGITCLLTAREKATLAELNAEYRRIPNEARADEFALSHLPRALDDLERVFVAA